jgi:hypothetical protein
MAVPSGVSRAYFRTMLAMLRLPIKVSRVSSVATAAFLGRQSVAHLRLFAPTLPGARQLSAAAMRGGRLAGPDQGTGLAARLGVASQSKQKLGARVGCFAALYVS